MENLKIAINENDYEASISCLGEAANDIFESTEADFRKIKEKKWYNRLWEIITFSKDNEKLLAHDVGNLAKLQEIVVKALLILSQKSTETFEILDQLSSKVEHLAEIPKELLIIIETTKYGFENTVSIEELNKNKKAIISNALIEYFNENCSDSEPSQTYRKNVLLKFHDINCSNFKGLEQVTYLDRKESKLLYQFLMEYNLIAFENYNIEDQIFDYIGLSRNEMKSIQSNIIRIYNLVGKEYFIEKHNPIVDVYLVDENNIILNMQPLEDQNESDRQTLKQEKLEEIFIDHILHVAPGETKIYENNIIHIKAFIHCEGNLAFQNCKLVYNETSDSDEITLSGNSSLLFSNCNIICKQRNTEYFIHNNNPTGACDIVFSNCVFENCSHFLSFVPYEGAASALHFKNCRMINLSYQFLSCEINSKSSVLIEDSEILWTEDFIQTHNRISYLLKNCFCLYEYGIHTKRCININNCIVAGVPTFLNLKFNYSVWKVNHAEFKNCTFNNLMNCIDGRDVSIFNCLFTCVNGAMSGTSTISECIFKNCENIITEISSGSKIRYCQFSNCKNLIISSDYSGGVIIEYCEFYNIKFEKKDTSKVGCISFNSSNNEHFSSNYVRKCIFNGIDVSDHFLMIGNVHEKVYRNQFVYQVEDCNFQNCVTQRESKVILSKYDYYYYGLFSDHTVDVTTAYIKNCKGLDRINQEGNTANGIMEKAQSHSGEIIGSTLSESNEPESPQENGYVPNFILM